MPVAITALYAALLGLMQIALQQLVGRERLRVDVSLGDGSDPKLREAMRRHGNFLEQVPLTLLMLALLELNGASPWLLHGLGSAWRMEDGEVPRSRPDRREVCVRPV